MERRLAAILAADMVGFSRQMGADEAGTLARLAALRTDVLDPLLAEHHGRLFKTMGDGFLAEFASAVQAVACALSIQSRLAENPDGLRLRIGIHQGDVVVQGDDLMGDGINIAARLEPLAEPGGLVISARVREDAAGKLDIAAQDMGEQTLKNIAMPLRAFRISVSGASSASTVLALPLPDKPSIAVLPFTNMSGDPEQEFFADGVAEDIITELSRFRGLFVIARNSSFTYRGPAVDIKRAGRELGVRYVLEGSVRRGGNRVRVTAQLIEAETGSHLWAERYDRDLTDVFAVQDEITQIVVRAIAPTVADAEQQRALRRPPESIGAWETYQRGLWLMGKATAQDVEAARELFEQATRLDPNFASAHAAIASALTIAGTLFGTRPLLDVLEPAEHSARQAVAHDPGNSEARATLAWLLGCRGDYASALPLAHEALAGNPNSAWTHAALGLLLLFGTDDKTNARNHLETALRLNPRDALSSMTEGNLPLTYYFVHDYPGAVLAARRAISRFPGYPPTRRHLAVALAQLGRTAEARTALEEAVAQAPDAVVAQFRAKPPWYRQQDYDLYLDGMRKAGWQS